MSGESTAEAAARIRRALPDRRDGEASRVTAVAGRMATFVLTAFGVDPADPPDDPSGLPAVSVLEVPGGVVAVTDGGTARPAPDALRWLSQDGTAAVLDGDDEGAGIACARDGVRSSAGTLVDGLDPAVLGRVSCGLILLERFTGLRIDGAARQARMPEYLTRARRQQLMPGLGAVRAASLSDDGAEDRTALSAAIARMDPYEQRRLAATAARVVMRPAGLRDDPDVVEALFWLTSPVGPRFGESVELAMMRARAAEERGGKTVRSRALRVLATAAGADPHLAALEAVWGVRDVLTPESRVEYDANVHKHISRVLAGA